MRPNSGHNKTLNDSRIEMGEISESTSGPLTSLIPISNIIFCNIPYDLLFEPDQIIDQTIEEDMNSKIQPSKTNDRAASIVNPVIDECRRYFNLFCERERGIKFSKVI